MDVVEARTDQNLDLSNRIQWTLGNWTESENERETFWRVTIVEKTDETNIRDIWVMRGEKTIDALRNNPFHVYQDSSSIDWNEGLFR